MVKRMIIMLLCLGVLFGGIFAYQAFKKSMMQRYMAKHTAPVVSVSTMKASMSEWQPHIKATGSLRAIRGVDITTELAGMIRTIYFKPGAQINQNAIVVKLNDDAEVATLHALQATANIAKITYERDKAQYDIKAVSKQVVDNDAATLKSALAQVAQQQATVDKKTIRAPFTGKAGISLVNPGQYLNPGDKITTLQTLNPIYVDFYIPQQTLSQLKLGQQITLTTDAFPNQTFNGKITTIDPIIDTATRNVQVEATVTNPKLLLLPGMFGTVEVISGKPEQYLTLPQTAISFNPYGNVAYIVAESGKDAQGNPQFIANQTFVTVGETRGDQITILKGIKAGETVVTSGQLKLRNGSPIAVNNKVVPKNSPDPATIDE